MIGINEGPITNAALFGGVKESGLGGVGSSTAWRSTWR